MRKLYKYLYFISFSWFLRKGQHVEEAKYSAFIVFDLLLLMNSLTLLAVADYFVDFKIDYENTSKFALALTVLLFSLPHYVLLIHSKAYLKMAKQFRHLREETKKKNNAIYWIYTLSSIALLFTTMLIQMRLNRTEILI